MNAQLKDAQTILARIEELERENHQLKRIGVALLLVGAMGLLMGQGKSQSQKATAWKEQTIRAGTIQATRVELVAPEGGLRAKLVADRMGSGASLMMFDKDGKPSVSLSSVIGPQLIMGQLVEASQLSEGYVSPFATKQTVQLEGTSSGGYLTLADESGRETVRMGAFAPDRVPGSTGSTHLSLISDAPTLLLGKHDGYRTEIGTTDLVTKATGETHRTSAASVVLFDDKGNVIWRVP